MPAILFSPRASGLALALAAAWLASPPVIAATLAVTTTSSADSADGHCSLREAIVAINAGANYRECSGSGYGSGDRITFALPGTGVQTIVMSDNFAEIVKPVTIDGLSQTGASCDAWPPTLRVELDGQGTVFRGLRLGPGSSGSVVRGMIIGGMANTFDNFSAGIALRSSHGNRIECNYLGMRADGLTANPNRRGIDINSSNENIVGTDGVLPALGRRNLISGNVYGGVSLRGASPSRNVVGGNYIGVDASGTQARSNSVGVGVNGQSTSPPAVDNVVGYNGVGSPEFARNIISGNDGSSSASGISMVVNAQRTRIAGNYIGLSADGSAAVPNRTGIAVGSNSSVLDNLIGYPSAQPLAVSGNVISGNTYNGIEINGINGTDRTFVVGNLIGTYPNGAAGLPNGSYGMTLISATSTLVNGNVISGHGIGIRLWGTGGKPMPNFLNATALPTGGDPLDSANNCVTGNTTGVSNNNGGEPRTITFAGNWWGAANGPGGAGGGSGDPVASGIGFSPFLTSAPSGCAVTPVADLAVEVSGVPTPIVAGTEFTATVGAHNIGPDATTGAMLRVTLADALPLTVPAGCSVVGQQLECPLGTIDSGARASMEVVFAVPDDASGSVSTTVSVTSAVLDPAAANNSLVVARDIVLHADLSVQVDNAAAGLVAGTEARWLIRARNDGPSRVTGASLDVPLPAGLGAAAWTCSASGEAQCSASGAGAIAQSLLLPPGGEVTFTLDTRVADGDQPVTLTANLAAPEGVDDLATDNNVDSLQLAVQRVFDLRAFLDRDSLADVHGGQSLALELRVSNLGPSFAAGAGVTLTLPDGADDLLWTCAASGGAICPAAGSDMLDASVDLPSGGEVLFEASMIVQAGERTFDALVVPPLGGEDPQLVNNADALQVDVLPPLADGVFRNGFELDTP